MDNLIARARQGQPRAVARLITLVENDEEAAQTAVSQLHLSARNAQIVGITGPPGCGKSSLVHEIAKTLRKQEKSVAIIAVDPTSPFTGGAILGDRLRMRGLAGDKGVFIRSMASRGNLGGLAQAVGAALKVLDAAGFDVILVETVGAGQAEVDIAAIAHTTVVVDAPGMGDDIQSIKAGILEIADILVVNKSDRPGAAQTAAQLEAMLQLGHSMDANRSAAAAHHGRLLYGNDPLQTDAPDNDAWQTAVLQTIAADGTGITALVQRITDHYHYLQTGDRLLLRNKERSAWEVEQLLHSRLLANLIAAIPPQERDALITAVAAREIDPYTAVDQLFNWSSHE